MQGNKFEARNLVWRTKGQHFEFDFISTPEEPSLLKGWGNIRVEVFERNVVFKKNEREVPCYGYGVLKDDGGIDWPFVAIRHWDTRKDENDRPIFHEIIWFPPNLKGKGKEIISSIPANWFDLVWKGGLDTVYGDEVHSLAKDGVKKRVKEKLHEIQLQIQPQSVSKIHENWGDVGVIFPNQLEEDGTGISPPQGGTDSEAKKKQISRLYRDSYGESEEIPEKTDHLVRGVCWLAGGVVFEGMALLNPLVGIVLVPVVGAMIGEGVYRLFLKK